MNNINSQLLTAIARIIKKDPVTSVQLTEAGQIHFIKMSGLTDAIELPTVDAPEAPSIDYSKIVSLVSERLDTTEMRNEIYESLVQEIPESESIDYEKINSLISEQLSEHIASKDKIIENLQSVTSDENNKDLKYSELREKFNALPTRNFIEHALSENASQLESTKVELLDSTEQSIKKVNAAISQTLSLTNDVVKQFRRYEAQEKKSSAALSNLQERFEHVPTFDNIREEAGHASKQIQSIKTYTETLESNVNKSLDGKITKINAIHNNLHKSIDLVAKQVTELSKSNAITDISFTEGNQLVVKFANGDTTDLTDEFLRVAHVDRSTSARKSFMRGGMGVMGEQGDPGLSAYQIAVRNGFNGTEKEWLESMKGSGEAAEPVLTKRVDFIDDVTILIGEAVPNSLETEPVWRIKQANILDEGTSVSVLWANGSELFEFIWNNRSTYTYS